MRQLKTWALIADGARAFVLEAVPQAPHWDAVDGMQYTWEHASTHEMVTDRPGRAFAAGEPSRSAMEMATDPHRARKTQFAQYLADRLEEARACGAYNRLVVAAPPQMLGDLRAHLSEGVRNCIVHEIHHDLTRTPIAELADHLKLGV